MSWIGTKTYSYFGDEFELVRLSSPTTNCVGVSLDGREMTFKVSSTESSNGSHPVTVWRIEDDPEGQREYRSFKGVLHAVCESLLRTDKENVSW